MLNERNQESPLVGIEARLVPARDVAASRFQLAERPFMTLLALRGGGAAFNAAAARVLGIALPQRSGGRAAAHGRAVWWMGPDEWLIQSAQDRAADLEQALRDGIGAQHCAVVDVSSGYTVIGIEGAYVREVLAGGCPLDLHRRVFEEGQCAQTHFFKAGVMLARDGDARFELIVRRSFAEYCCRMLLDSAEPYLA